MPSPSPSQGEGDPIPLRLRYLPHCLLLMLSLLMLIPPHAVADPDPTLRLPDGRYYESWEQPQDYTRTYHVAQQHDAASDDNPGTEDEPFLTIQAAAEVLEPGERVLIHDGTYRETVRPRRGGTGPDAMIAYQAAPGQTPIITGAEAYTGPWEEQARWNTGWKLNKPGPDTATGTIYHVRLPERWFVGYLPFAMANLPQHHTVWGGEIKNFPAELRWKLALKRGLIFQDGRRLTQVSRPKELDATEGAYWPEENGLDIYIRPFGDTPDASAWEFTTREQGFAPREKNLDYIRVSGLTIRHVSDPWAFPQRAALSASHGRHWIIEDNHVFDVNCAAIDVGREQWGLAGRDPQGFHIIRGNHIQRAGILGIAGWAPEMTNLLVEDNLIEDCGWHDLERLWEVAAIKLLHVKDAVFRRNLIRNNTDASGLWLDFGIENVRVTGNVILNTTTGYGGIFIEAAKVGSIMIDRNIIGGSRKVAPLSAAAGAGAEAVNGGHGIYAHDSDRLIVAHNLIFDCEGSGVHLALGQPDRIAIVGRGAICRDNRVHNNVVIDCGRYVHFGRPHNFAEGNLYVGRVSAYVSRFQIGEPLENLDWTAWQEFHGFDRRGHRIDSQPPNAEVTDDNFLRVTLPSELPTVPALPFYLEPQDADADTERVLPGPFDSADRWKQPIDLDPRRLGQP